MKKSLVILTLSFVMILGLSVLACATNGEINQIAEYFGLDLLALAGISVTIVMITNFVKDKFNLQGMVNLAVVAGLSVAYSIFTYQGVADKIIVASILLTILSAGAWSSVKRLAHKVGTESESTGDDEDM